jgi:hypothetical protein
MYFEGKNFSVIFKKTIISTKYFYVSWVRAGMSQALLCYGTSLDIGKYFVLPSHRNKGAV